jgi:MFS family permease
MSERQTRTLTPAETNWPVVLLATFAGITAALHLGKAAATLPLIRAEFGADLTLLATYVSLISVVAATTGLVFGTLTRRVGARRAGIAGLLFIAAGSAGGAVAVSVPFLLVTRVVEAIGFALTVTAMPALIQPASATKHKSLTLGIWSTWLPAGVALMMAIAWLVLDSVGWRGVFWIGAALPIFSGLMLAAVTRRGETRGKAGLALNAVRGLFRRETMLIAGNFITFSATNLIVMAFLPTLLVDEFAMTPTDATLISFFAALTLIPGNIAGGWLLDRGYDARTLFLISFCGMLAAAFFLLSDWAPQEYRIISAFIFSACTGVPPSLVWSSIPTVMRTPDEAPLLSGFYYQGAGLGQLVGPILAGIAVEDFGGWFSAFWIILALMLAAIVFSAMMPPRR